MSVHLKEIQVKNLGPVSKFSMNPRLINLIYGQNEKGKTHLVEFIIRSLFRNTRMWQLRKSDGQGKVVMGGLEKKDRSFSIASREKLEDFLEKNHPGLPPDISKLLVVKGAEVGMGESESSADIAILKKYLSSQGVLDHIDSRISKTIQETSIQHQTIHGAKRGEIKNREELEEQLESLNRLFMQIDKGYSGGRRKILAGKRKILETDMNRMIAAKCHLAFRISRQIQSLEKKKHRIPETGLREVRETLIVYKQKIEEYKHKKKEQLEAESGSKDYDWLSSASEVYQQILSAEKEKPTPIFLILAVIMITAAAVLTFFRLPFFAAGALGGILLFGILHLRKIHAVTIQASENQELRKLEHEFQERFGEPLSGLAMLREFLFKMNEDYSKSRLLKDQLYSDLRSIEGMKLKLAERIHELSGERSQPETWEKVLTELDGQFRDMEEQVRELRLTLARLDVDSSDFLEQSNGIEYSRTAYDAILHDMNETQEDIEQENHKLSTLKQLICQQTGDDISAGWDRIIRRLQEKRETVLMAYKQKTAEIIGKKMVHRVLETLQKDEDSKIVEGLQSPVITEPLYQMTGRYNSFHLSGKELFVSDPFNDFPLSELSTGAQEQILLALRVGFAGRLFRDNRLFLILDDAFQYSDWSRRGCLIDTTLALAKNGWQIFYFTMDDHIRDLFKKKSASFGQDFCYQELKETT